MAGNVRDFHQQNPVLCEMVELLTVNTSRRIIPSPQSHIYTFDATLVVKKNKIYTVALNCPFTH